MNYYLLVNTPETAFLFEGKSYPFKRTHFVHPTNSWWGVLATQDDALDKCPRVEKISKEDFDKLCARSGDNLKVAFEMEDPLKPAPVVKPEPLVKPTAVLDEILAAKKVVKKATFGAG